MLKSIKIGNYFNEIKHTFQAKFDFFIKQSIINIITTSVSLHEITSYIRNHLTPLQIHSKNCLKKWNYFFMMLLGLIFCYYVIIDAIQ